jgi:pimeloyl-ACP methyl ester carboxylesterase
MHPRLFTTLVLIDPAMGTLSSTPPEAGPNPGMLSTFRKDVWLSRDAAAEEFKASRFYQKWDPRVLDRWIECGLRDLPTPIYPDGTMLKGKKPVTLTTTKHQEVFTFVRPNFDGYGPGKAPDRRTHADLNPNLPTIYPFYRADSPWTFFRLPELRPSVLYIFGRQSSISAAPAWQAKMETTGIGVGGSGGAKADRVKSVWLEDVGHLMPMEAVGQTADAALDWLDSEMQRWTKEEDEFRKMWSTKPMRGKRMVDDEWKEMMGLLLAKKLVAPKM